MPIKIMDAKTIAGVLGVIGFILILYVFLPVPPLIDREGIQKEINYSLWLFYGTQIAQINISNITHVLFIDAIINNKEYAMVEAAIIRIQERYIINIRVDTMLIALPYCSDDVK